MSSEKLWGGRFAKDTDPSVIDWTQSITVDTKMVAEDLWGSMAHVTMLGHQGIIPFSDAAKIVPTLLSFLTSFQKGEWALNYTHEDVHMNVEARLIAQLGMEVGGKMHTSRSRNDQVVLDSKLHARNELLILRESLTKVCQVLLDRSFDGLDDVMVGYTHVQHAQPVSIGFWLSSYVAAFLRDLKRLKAAYDLTDASPLGAGALAGSAFPIDRELSARLLGFQRVDEHSMDTTSARDFMLEILSANAILETTASKLAEEFILWSSYEFRTVSLDDGFAMGSSMMPQKKNPGSVELLRGRSGRMNGYLMAGLTMMKGLPSGYNRDFHEEKEITFASLELANLMATMLPQLIATTTFNKTRMEELSYANFSAATELANYLVRNHAVPFRKAHHIIGSLVGELSRAGTNFSDVDTCLAHFAKNNIAISKAEMTKVTDTREVMRSYASQGGTAPEAVRAMLTTYTTQLAAYRREIEVDKQRVDSAREATFTIARSLGEVTSHEQFRSLVAKFCPRA